jgi:glycosyltransferase 2 family protein
LAGGAAYILAQADSRRPRENEEGGTIRRRRRRIGLIVATLAALGAIALIAHRWRQSGFEFHIFLATFLQLRWGWLAVSFVLAVTTYFARVLRWRILLLPLKTSPTVRGIWNATAIGFAAVVLLGRAAEWVRPYLIAKKEQVSVSSQMAAWLLERIYDLLSVLVILGFTLMRISASGAKLGPTTEWILRAGGGFVGFTSALCLLILLGLHLYSQTFENRLLAALSFLPATTYANVTAVLRAFIGGAASIKNLRSVSQLVAYTVIEWLLIAAVYAALLKSDPATAQLSLTDALLLLGFVSFGSAVQIPAVGGGTQLACVVVLTEMFKVPLEVATGLAIVIWVVTFVSVLPFGVLAAIQEGLSVRKILEIKEETPV